MRFLNKIKLGDLKVSLYGNDLRVENRYSHILKKWYVKSNDRFINLICEPYQKLNFIESLIGDCLIMKKFCM